MESKSVKIIVGGVGWIVKNPFSMLSWNSCKVAPEWSDDDGGKPEIPGISSCWTFCVVKRKQKKRKPGTTRESGVANGIYDNRRKWSVQQVGQSLGHQTQQTNTKHTSWTCLIGYQRAPNQGKNLDFCNKKKVTAAHFAERTRIIAKGCPLW